MNLYFILTVYKYNGNYNNINDKYAKLCVLDVVKDMNIKAFNLISRTNETRCVFWHETCTCQCRLDASIFHDNQRWKNDKCRCKYKELIGKGRCDDRFIWNPSTCECECDKSCDVEKYLDYENCKCRKTLTDKLASECEDKILYATDTISITNKKVTCKNNCLIYIILLIIMCLILLTIVSISCYYCTRYWLKKRILNAILNI